jgi:3-hydroxyacyl-CoA dehydrogenase / enoyl-CoA hydratase / 3-hydroxybutyryl-CoA epimerase
MTKNAWDVLAPRDIDLGPFSSQRGATPSPWQHWKLARDEDGIAWLLFDKNGARVNTLSEAVLMEFQGVLDTIERDLPKGLVLRSGKSDGFIAGADVGAFRGMKDAGEVETQIAGAHVLLDRFDHLKIPTVAVIHGYCLGGGLEIALACDYRIAIDGASFGFPETLLGLHPGFGGTVRSTQLINPIEAMNMMLTGRTIRARRARSLGLIDAVTQERHVRAAVKAAVNGELKTSRSKIAVQLSKFGPARTLLAQRMRTEAMKKTRPEHYPQPYALIDLWEKHGADPHAMQQAEIASFSRLLVSDTAQNLVRVFFLREKLKGQAAKNWSGRRVHVIGAGAMGGDIAAWCAWRGLVVSLADVKPEPIAGAVKRATELFSKIADKPTQTRDALDRLIPDLKGEGVRLADLVIEAAPENLDLKQKVYAQVEPHMRPDAILATNTSSIPLEKLRVGLQRPDQFVGLHFFNPVSRLQLVELVHHDGVSAEVLEQANAFLGRIDRLPAAVQSAPGFLVNRALTPYMLEAMLLADERFTRETIDAAAERFGMPMGPIELADQVGLDICLHVADVLRSSLDRKMPEIPQWLRDKVAKGELGRKTGRGLYEWRNGKAVKTVEPQATTPEMTDRLILPLLDVCVGCLREGIVADEDTVDGAMVFATGFAPFRGGPMHYARTRGVADIKATLARLSQRYGDRFRPDPGWDRLV